MLLINLHVLCNGRRRKIIKVAYFSPLNPIKSGISDFSEELLPYLKRYMDIDLFLSDYLPSNKIMNDIFSTFHIKEYDNPDIRKKYDIAVFHVGNNYQYHKEIVDTYLKYGGVLELHDISLHHYLAEDIITTHNNKKYIEIMKYCHGSKGEKVAKEYLDGYINSPWENRSLEFTVCKHLIDKADGIIVHSDFAKQMVKGINPNSKVINIPLHTPDIINDFESNKFECRKILGINNDEFVMGAFGHATANKRIFQILDALDLLKKSEYTNFKLFIVGKVSGLDIEKKIKNLNLEQNINITGFTTLEQFKTYMGACDVCLNLRYPTQGESSASLHRMLGMGKPVLITNIGAFEEYPDDMVVKVPYNDIETMKIYESLMKLISDKNLLNGMSKKAYEYAMTNCNVETNAIIYHNYFNDIINETYNDSYIETVIDKLIEIGLTDDMYINHILNNQLIKILHYKEFVYD